MTAGVPILIERIYCWIKNIVTATPLACWIDRNTISGHRDSGLNAASVATINFDVMLFTMEL